MFFPVDGPMRIGAAAAEALIEGDEGRYMRALKSVLGTPLFHEQRLLGGRRRTLALVVSAFLREVKLRAEAASGLRFETALSGRPVRFHGDPERDARAEEDLRQCYLAAGFEEVAFMYEPEAAALAGGSCGFCRGATAAAPAGIVRSSLRPPRIGDAGDETKGGDAETRTNALRSAECREERNHI